MADDIAEISLIVLNIVSVIIELSLDILIFSYPIIYTPGSRDISINSNVMYFINSVDRFA